MDIGLALYKIRKQKGLKLDALALVADTDTGYLSRIEQGRRQPSIGMLEKIAAGLGCTVSEIVTVAETHISAENLADGSDRLAVPDMSGPSAMLRRVARDLTDEELLLVVDFCKMLMRRR